MAIHRTSFMVEVLSDGPLPVPPEGIDLPELDYLTSEGPCIGHLHMIGALELRTDEVRDELVRFGNDGTFFDPVDE